MKPGNLVKITRRSIGIPKDALALAIGFYKSEGGYHVWEVMLNTDHGTRTRRYLEQDLEVIS